MNAKIYWRVLFSLAIIVSSLLAGGCNGKSAVGGEEITQPPENTATTAPTNTPLPSATPTATDTPLPTATWTPKPTATATPNQTATAEAIEAAWLADMLKRIEPDITAYGYKLEDGELIWSYEDPIEITVEDYGTSLFQNLDAPVTGNFILQTHITWNTTGGLAGCGIFFRMDENPDGASNQFMLYRLQSAPAWNISFYDKGLWQRFLADWVFSKSIIDKNDATNVVTLVVDGRNIYPYINGKKQRLVEDIKLKEGLFALSATQESGVSICKFEDTWIWQINPK